MRRVIVTKFLPAKSLRGARIKAKAKDSSRPCLEFDQSMTMPFDHGLSAIENHVKAANQFMRALKWDLHSALELPKAGCGYMAHVLVAKPKNPQN